MCILLHFCTCVLPRGRVLGYFQCLGPFCKVNELILSDHAYCKDEILGKLWQRSEYLGRQKEAWHVTWHLSYSYLLSCLRRHLGWMTLEVSSTSKRWWFFWPIPHVILWFLPFWTNSGWSEELSEAVATILNGFKGLKSSPFILYGTLLIFFLSVGVQLDYSL